ncbi:MAG: outer membrane protein transport protein [candidate division KSB1 bacterium]|nr:outer membrane protein transport protein [candidate division KSB1 bacterium]
MAANWRLKETVYFGVAVFGNGGMNTNYPTNTFYGTTPTGVDLMQLFVAATLSFQLAEKHGIGISPIFSFQRFQAQGLQAFGNFSSDANKLTNNDYDSATGFGLRIGYFGQWMDFLAFGAAYQTKINMGQFSKYAGLFAGGGDFDIPANWTVGVALGYEAFAIAFDVQRIMYSSISSIANPMFPNLQQAPLGADGAAGFGWEDMTVFKIGVQMQRGEAWTYRAGFSTGKQPIPESEVMFNILAPGVIEKHLTFGVSRKLNSGKELSLSITRALSGSVQGPNPLEAPQPANHRIENGSVGIRRCADILTFSGRPHDENDSNLSACGGAADEHRYGFLPCPRKTTGALACISTLLSRPKATWTPFWIPSSPQPEPPAGRCLPMSPAACLRAANTARTCLCWPIRRMRIKSCRPIGSRDHSPLLTASMCLKMNAACTCRWSIRTPSTAPC